MNLRTCCAAIFEHGQSFPEENMRARTVFLAMAILGLGACTPADSTPSTAGSPAPALAVRLRYMPDPPFCLLAGIPPGIVLRINPAADEQIVAIDVRGREYHVWWQRGFRSGLAGDPVVLDPGGGVVARDGDPLTYPAVGSPNLHGYEICAGNESVYVLLEHV
jgi:hypothetical protein